MRSARSNTIRTYVYLTVRSSAAPSVHHPHLQSDLLRPTPQPSLVGRRDLVQHINSAMQSSGSGRLHDQLSAAMDMKDAVAGKDVYAHHIENAEGGLDAYAVNQELDQEFTSDKPSLEKLEKLVSIKDSIKSHAAPVEEQLWQGQMDDAIARADT